MVKIISDLFKKENENDLTSVFNSKNSITANDAYRISRFGDIKTDKKLLEEFFVNVRDTIQHRTMRGKFSAIVELNQDIIQFIPQIKKRLMTDLGFKVIVLDDHSIISNTETNNKEYLMAGTTFILLIWTKDAIKDVENSINSNIEKINKENLKPLNS